MLYLKRKKKFRKDRIVTGNLLQYTGTPCPRTVTGFCRCFTFRIGKIRGHNGIIRNFQFRKFLPMKSNLYSSEPASPFSRYLLTYCPV